MLRLDGEAFCTGRSSFLDSPPLPVELASKLFVRVRIGGIETLAQLDTGAAWSFEMLMRNVVQAVEKTA